jgi:hypothetical protein
MSSLITFDRNHVDNYLKRGRTSPGDAATLPGRTTPSDTLTMTITRYHGFQ